MGDHSRRFRVLVSLLLVFGLWLGGCAGGSATKSDPGAGDPSSEAPIVIGAVTSETGPNASLGISMKNTYVLMEARWNEAGGINGRPVRLVIYDDGSDATKAAQAARKLIQEDRAVALIGTSPTPATMAMMQVAHEAEVPLLATAPTLQSPMAPEYEWVFQIPRSVGDLIKVVAGDMQSQGFERIGYIGFNDSWGDSWYDAATQVAPSVGAEVISNERFARADTSVAGQVLKVLTLGPDAMLLGAVGTPAVLPHRTLVERGFEGMIYHTHGVTNPDFLKVGGEVVEGSRLPSDPLPVVDELPDTFPSKAKALEFRDMYEAVHGEGTANTFGAYAFDAVVILQTALPRALEAAGSDDPASIRAALRDALEETREVAGASGVYSFSPDRHMGLDDKEAVLITVKDGKWSLLSASH